jgi:putative tricarboxylic transport membrane protein
MKRARLITSAILLGLACATLIETGKLPIGNLHSPQAGFFPLMIGLLLGIFSVVLLVQSLKEKRGETTSAPASTGRQKRILFTLGALFFVALFFERLGYLISTFLLIGFLLAAVSRQKAWVVITTAFLSSVISYLLFGVVLQTQLPAGILSRFFGI